MRIKDVLKKVPGLNWIARTNKNIFDLQQKTQKLESDLNDAYIAIEKINGKVLLDKETRKINKIAVYTVLIGNYDNIYDPIYTEDEYCDYYCVTDNAKLKSNIWNIIYVNPKNNKELKGLDNTKISRYYKTHPQVLFKKYKHSIYIDANLTIRKSLVLWYNIYSQNNDFLIFKHPDRECLYDEAKECIVQNKDNEETINKQIARYTQEGYPKKNGLVMANMIYRKHTPEINKLCESWWKEIKKGSKRDQLSFNYVLWKSNVQIDLCPLHAAFNEYFIYNYHIKQ